MNKNATIDKHLDSLLEKVATLIEQARQHVATTVKEWIAEFEDNNAMELTTIKHFFHCSQITVHSKINN
ncbi:MAG: hypothetical protein J5605_09715 [Bacteroidales bacterium]|nr:hypothetical protein [Bacteroidales bacterium]